MRISTRRPITTSLCLLAVLLAAPMCLANASDSDQGSFDQASFLDIDLTPALETNVLTYTLSLGVHPKITIGSNTYDVNWVQQYCIVSQDTNTSFVATNGSVVTDWNWKANDKPIQTAGWTGTGNSRLYPGQSKTLGFASLNTTGNAVLSGMHIGYQDGSTEVTGHWKGGLPATGAVPEPSSALALLGGLAGSLWRRRPAR